MRSNCLFFAVYMTLSRGGYFVIRFSEVAGWHFQWSQDRKTYLQYEPFVHQKLPRAIVDKLWYRGKITRSDDIGKARRTPKRIPSWLVLLVSIWIIFVCCPLNLVAFIRPKENGSP